jgi:hypothetical protein
MKLVTLMLLGVLLSGCDLIPFSGGELSGNLTTPPADWTDVASKEVIELETNPAEPYSVKLWIIGAGPDLYVHAGANRTTWVEHIEQDANVRLQIDDALYELRAVRVESPEEFAAFAVVYEEKYGIRPRNENVEEAYLFRLLPR